MPAPQIRNRVWLAVVLLNLVPGIQGCTGLLPTGSDEEPLPWGSFDEISGVVGRIVPYETTRGELHEQRIEPASNPSVTILNYSDLLQRFPAASAVPIDQLERGIADCLRAGKRCTAYAIAVRQVKTRRVGNFWLDVLNFRRHTVTTGWSFTALIVLVDDTVVYALTAGQPKIEEEQITRNPLGPLQGLGETLRPRAPSF